MTTENANPTPVTAEAAKKVATPRKRKPAAKAKAKKPAAKAKARKPAKAKAKSNGAGRSKWDDAAKIKVVGEHTRREGSAYYKAYEAMKKLGTVARFRAAKFGNNAHSKILRDAVTDKYIRIG